MKTAQQIKDDLAALGTEPHTGPIKVRALLAADVYENLAARMKGNDPMQAQLLAAVVKKE